jgi:hypothetical protein
MTEHLGPPSDNTTLTEVLDAYASAGYDAHFEVANESSIHCVSCGTESAASEYAMNSRRRLEGASDPDDMLSVVAVTCPRCEARGTLVLGFGPAASDTEAAIGQLLRATREDGDVPPAAAPGENNE